MAEKKPNTFGKLMSLFLPREKKQIFLLCLAILAMGVFQVFGVASVLPFINLIMRPELIENNKWFAFFYEGLGFTSPNSFIFFVGIVMLSIIIISNAVSAFTIWIKFRFIFSRNHRISRTLLQKYMYRPYAFFLDKNTSEMKKNILDEVNLMTQSFLLPLLELISRVVIVLLLFIFLLIVDPLITIVALLFLGTSYYLANFVLKKRLKKGGKIRVETNRMRYKITSEALEGIKEIKLLGRENHFIKNYSENSWKFARVHSFRNAAGLLPKFLLEAVAFGGIILLVLYLIYANQNLGEVIPIVSLFAFAGYRLMPSLQVIFNSVTQVYANQATLDNIYQEMKDLGEGDFFEEQKEQEIKNRALPFTRDLEIINLDYTYPGSKELVLSDVNITLKKGEKIGIVGPTGAGKTTFVDLILGLLVPTRGEILIDGEKLTRNNVRSWQNNIGYVPQDIFLIDGNIASNIAFGIADNEIDIKALEKAARIANIHDFIKEELPLGYGTLVGERGVKLSGGQKQRIGLARALYHNPEILVLDEATSSLDGSTEEQVMLAMDDEAKVDTIIIIAHRLNTIKDCDIIHLFNRGSLIESGTYSNLLNSSELFRSMARAGRT